MTGRGDRLGLLAEAGRFLRANLSSTAATALDWALVTALIWLGLHYLYAAAVGAAAGAVTDFALKRHWAFDRAVMGAVHHEGFRYLLVSGGSLGWNLLLAYGLVGGLGMAPVPGVIAASLVVGFLWNYPLHRLFVFPRGRPGPPMGEPGGAAREGAGKGTPWAVVCDFDGTATMDDMADALSIRYGGYDRWKRANDRFQAGAISFERLLKEIFEPITATAEELRAFAREHARFRPGFERLVALCRQRGFPFVLVSGGLDVYIHPALETLPRDLTEGLEVRANHAELHETGLTLTFPGKGAPGACGSCGSCKGSVVRELKERGLRVVAVGDGNADRCSARVADLVFARGRLLDWCRETGLACEPFETLDAVADRLARESGS
jgi:2-hydroxy-3-keto-5-methylthiopentenyl-1-phosphate phosphatase